MKLLKASVVAVWGAARLMWVHLFCHTEIHNNYLLSLPALEFMGKNFAPVMLHALFIQYQCPSVKVLDWLIQVCQRSEKVREKCIFIGQGNWRKCEKFLENIWIWESQGKNQGILLWMPAMLFISQPYTFMFLISVPRMDPGRKILASFYAIWCFPVPTPVRIFWEKMSA